MFNYNLRHFDETLFAKLRSFRYAPRNFKSLNEDIGYFFSRIDYYVSLESLVRGYPVGKLLRENFSGGLLNYLLAAKNAGCFGHFGNAVDPVRFAVHFPTSETTLIWIPKNANTAVKRQLLQFEPEERRAKIRKHLFHETLQAEFGLDRLTWAKARPENTTIVVRNPYERIVSCYLDKFAGPVMRGGEFEGFVKTHIGAALALLDIDAPPERSLSFAEFISYVEHTPAYAWDDHWRPQFPFTFAYPDARLIPTSRLDLLTPRRPVKRANASVGAEFRPAEKLTGEFAETLPEKLTSSSITSYNQLVTPSLMARLRMLYGADEPLWEKALATAAADRAPARKRRQ
ncbi:sulfotransferase family 2 domain-containing protein [Jiella endophytica]|uniref:sulfotransferase family 2 domain-containing protein n=1 Tax=Jiella endophytica TaxID=2558362 RepID=UPI0014306B36|nr:sulfotransferase family 2 domain-containing protein [Jiella endophytica]